MFNHDSSLIKNTLDIYNLFKNIQKSKQLITLSFESLPQHCLTSLLEVRFDSKELIFDEPNPQLNPDIINIKKEAEFSLKLEQLPVIFKTQFISSNTEKKSNELHTHFPVEIYYPQNRTFFRLRTEFKNNIKTTIFLSATKQIPGQLLNISLNGLCLRFPYSFAAKFKVNQLIDDIYIELPDQNGFSISARVKNTRIENNHSNIVVGLQILEQKTSIEKTIQQFIFRSENT